MSTREKRDLTSAGQGNSPPRQFSTLDMWLRIANRAIHQGDYWLATRIIQHLDRRRSIPSAEQPK